MNEEEKILTALKGTELGGRIARLREIYASLAEAQERFCRSFGIHCVGGCGACCEHFTPTLSRAEAEYLAFGLIASGRAEEVLSGFEAEGEPSSGCPLYDPKSAYHCTVYAWRPLICRLFGGSASLTKDGRPAFRHCKWNSDGVSIPPEKMEARPEDVVTMTEYAMRLEQEETGNREDEPLRDALRKATAEINFFLELLTEQTKTPDE